MSAFLQSLLLPFHLATGDVPPRVPARPPHSKRISRSSAITPCSSDSSILSSTLSASSNSSLSPAPHETPERDAEADRTPSLSVTPLIPGAYPTCGAFSAASVSEHHSSEDPFVDTSAVLRLTACDDSCERPTQGAKRYGDGNRGQVVKRVRFILSTRKRARDDEDADDLGTISGRELKRYKQGAVLPLRQLQVASSWQVLRARRLDRSHSEVSGLHSLGSHGQLRTYPGGSNPSSFPAPTARPLHHPTFVITRPFVGELGLPLLCSRLPHHSPHTVPHGQSQAEPRSSLQIHQRLGTAPSYRPSSHTSGSRSRSEIGGTSAPREGRPGRPSWMTGSRLRKRRTGLERRRESRRRGCRGWTMQLRKHRQSARISRGRSAPSCWRT